MSKTPKRYENFRVFRYFCLFSGSKNFDPKSIQKSENIFH